MLEHALEQIVLPRCLLLTTSGDDIVDRTLQQGYVLRVLPQRLETEDLSENRDVVGSRFFALAPADAVAEFQQPCCGHGPLMCSSVEEAQQF